MEANYLLITKDLPDFSHVRCLREGMLGNEETASAKIEVEEHDCTLWASRIIPNMCVPEQFKLMFKRYGGKVSTTGRSFGGTRPAAC